MGIQGAGSGRFIACATRLLHMSCYLEHLRASAALGVGRRCDGIEVSGVGVGAAKGAHGGV